MGRIHCLLHTPSPTFVGLLFWSFCFVLLWSCHGSRLWESPTGLRARRRLPGADRE